MTRAEVIAEARTWVGTRFHHQAAVKGVGCDCIGLIAGVAAAVGMLEAAAWLADARCRSYTREPAPQMLLGAATDYLLEIPRWQLGPADIPLFRVRNGKYGQHFAILTADDPPRMIHAHAGFRRVVENTFDSVWTSQVTHAFRYRALA